jgi:hypothetical protein
MIAIVTAVNVWGNTKKFGRAECDHGHQGRAYRRPWQRLLALGFRKARTLEKFLGARIIERVCLLSGIGFAMITVLWAHEAGTGTYSAGEVLDPQRCFSDVPALIVDPDRLYLSPLWPSGGAWPTQAAASDAIVATAARAVLVWAENSSRQ